MDKVLLDKLLKETDEKYGEALRRLAEGEPNDDYVWEEDRQKDDETESIDENDKERE